MRFFPMIKINYLIISNLIAIFLIITSSSTIFAADDEDFDEDELPIVKKSVCWPNGDCYEGEYEGKNRNGKGTYTWANGDRYVGEFYEGKRDGSGTYIWTNGDRYVGEYLEDKRDGEGTYTWANGDQFKGEFVEGKRRQGKMVRAKTTPVQSKPTLKSETPVLTPPTTLTKSTDEPNQLENKINVAQSAQEKVVPNNSKIEKLTEVEENKTIATESIPANRDKTAKTIASVKTDIEKLKDEATLTPKELNDSLEKDSVTTKNLAKIMDEDLMDMDDDFSSDHLIQTNKKLTDEKDTKEPKVEEKIATTVTADEKPVKTEKETITEEKETISAQKLTIAKLEDKQSVKSTADIPKILENQPPLKHLENVPHDTNLVSKPILFKWPNGDSYEGEYVNSERTGNGTYVWANSDRYTGDFMAGKRHGIGIYVWAKGDRYEGEYVNDERHGIGTYIWANGDRYEGDFFKGQRHGKGKLTWADGEIYEGAFAEGKRTGIGVYISSGGDRYEGYFEDGKRSGKGILILADRQPKQLEFENELYTLDELEFKQGRLVSAAAISQVEDEEVEGEEEDETDQEMENNAKEGDSTAQTPPTTGNSFLDRNPGNTDPQEKPVPPITTETRHDSNELPNDNNKEDDNNNNEEHYDPFLDDEETDDNNELPSDNKEAKELPLSSEEKNDHTEFQNDNQNDNQDEEY